MLSAALGEGTDGQDLRQTFLGRGRCVVNPGIGEVPERSGHDGMEPVQMHVNGEVSQHPLGAVRHAFSREGPPRS